MKTTSRRDFLQKLFAFGLTLSFYKPTKVLSNPLKPNYYPPSLTGIRGNHNSSYKYAHKIAFENKNFKVDEILKEKYDLIVVGAGISGLASAYFYLQYINKNARILILDNHDDFGGHAKRNEFQVNGKTLLSYGGTQSFDTISDYSNISKTLLKDLGIELEKFESYYDKNFFEKYDLCSAIFCSQNTFGENKLVKSSFPVNVDFKEFSNAYMPYLKQSKSFENAIEDLPLNKKQKKKLYEILESNEDIEEYEASNYVDFLKEAFDVEDKALTDLLSMVLSDDTALGGKAIGIEEAYYSKLLGVSKKDFLPSFDNEKYIHHFPDGNATLARLLVQKLIPNIASFKNVEESILSKFDYSKLDKNSNQINIRLNAFVNSIKNKKDKTLVQYIKDDKCIEIEVKHTIMAGWHSTASYIIEDLPKKQKELLRSNVKMPLVYVQVVFKNWNFLQKAGVASTYCPSSYFQFVNTDFPINIGSYKAIETPNKPMVLTMMRMSTPNDVNEKVNNLLRLGRAQLLRTSLEDFQKNIKDQLEAMFAPYGFEYKRDVFDVVINRWGHGYTYEGALSQKQLRKARKKVGNIYFANADSAGYAYSNASIDMAFYAIKQIKKSG